MFDPLRFASFSCTLWDTMRFSNMDHIFLKRDILPAPTKLEIKLGSAMVNSWLRFLRQFPLPKCQCGKWRFYRFWFSKGVFSKNVGIVYLGGYYCREGPGRQVVQTQHMSILVNVWKNWLYFCDRIILPYLTGESHTHLDHGRTQLNYSEINFLCNHNVGGIAIISGIILRNTRTNQLSPVSIVKDRTSHKCINHWTHHKKNRKGQTVARGPQFTCFATVLII